MSRRIAFVTESQTRQAEPMPAFLFYQSPKSRWINSVIKYLSEKFHSRDDIYFLSYANQRIINYEEVIDNYPKEKWHPRKSECAVFAGKILEMVLSFPEIPFVELHMGQTLAFELRVLFEKHGVPHKFYGEGQSLAQKPEYYQRLIEEERNIHQVRDIRREEWGILVASGKRTPNDAQRIIDEHAHKTHLFKSEVEVIFEDLKHVMKKHRSRQKAEKEAFDEFLEAAQDIENPEELRSFITDKDMLYQLCFNIPQYQRVKAKYGKLMAMFEAYLIKRECVVENENKISSTLLRLQISLL
jgi:hypothetical protein